MSPLKTKLESSIFKGSNLKELRHGCNWIFQVRCLQSTSIFSILVPLWFIIVSLVFFYLNNLLLLGCLQFKGNFVCVQNNSKYWDLLLWYPQVISTHCFPGEQIQYWLLQPRVNLHYLYGIFYTIWILWEESDSRMNYLCKFLLIYVSLN